MKEKLELIITKKQLEELLEKKNIEHRKRVHQIQINLQENWSKSWNKTIQHIINISNRTHTTDGHKVNAMRIALKKKLK